MNAGRSLDPDAEEVRRALAEDLGTAGDVTTRAAAPDAETRLTARVVAREAGVLAGLAEASLAFAELGAKVEHHHADGDTVPAHAVVATVTGPATAVLGAERVALNYLMRMSGIATTTRRLNGLATAANPDARVAATRKTTPLFRRAEKRAVVLGGGDPHRFGLFDAFLVKDNHRELAGGDVAELVRRCRAVAADLVVEIEVESLEDALAAAAAGADWLLIDNVTPQTFAAWAQAVRAAHPGVRLEASGGITGATVAAYAAHADRVSMGALTHSATALDFGLDL